MRSVLCDPSMKSCSKNRNLLTVSLLTVELDLQTPLAGDMLTTDLSGVLSGWKPHTNHVG